MAIESILISASLSHSYEGVAIDEQVSIAKTGTYVIAVVDTDVADGNTLSAEIDAVRNVYKTKALFSGRIAGHDYTNGRVLSIQTGSNNLNGDAEITITIQENILNTAPPSGGLTKYFDGLIPAVEYLNSLSENYSYSREGDNFSAAKTISFSYSPEVNISNFITDLQQFSTAYKGKRDDYLRTGITDGITGNWNFSDNNDANFQETIDLTNFSYSLTETCNTFEISGDYSVSKSYSDSIDAEGYKRRTAQVNLTSLKTARDITLQTAVKTEALAIINDSSEFAPAGETVKPVSITKGFTIDGSSATLTMVFSNRPEERSGDVIQYSASEQVQNSIKSYALNISFKNTDGETKAEKWGNTKALYIAEQTNLKTYITDLFGSNLDLHDVATNASLNRGSIIINQTSNFTTEDIYDSTTQGILKKQLSASTDNVETNAEEHRLEVPFAIVEKQDFIKSNLLGKVTTVRATASVTFTDFARDSIMGYMKSIALEGELLAEADKIKEVSLPLTINDDVVSVDFTGYAATRTITFISES